MVFKKDKIQMGYEWYVSPQGLDAPQVCQNRALFQARLSSMHLGFVKKYAKDKITLLDAVVAEIGINCFDHNLGKWKDVPGCWFDYNCEKNKIWVVISDRGQGILSSLKRVVPELKSDQEAVETAFQKRISGRSPEQRGNGLKFVRNIINGNKDRGLLYLSGSGRILLGCLSSEAEKIIEMKKVHLGGTLAFLIWNLHEN